MKRILITLLCSIISIINIYCATTRKITTKKKTVIFSNDNFNAPEITQVGKNKCIECIGINTKGTFYKVNINNKVGWINVEMVKENIINELFQEENLAIYQRIKHREDSLKQQLENRKLYLVTYADSIIDKEILNQKGLYIYIGGNNPDSINKGDKYFFDRIDKNITSNDGNILKETIYVYLTNANNTVYLHNILKVDRVKKEHSIEASHSSMYRSNWVHSEADYFTAIERQKEEDKKAREEIKAKIAQKEKELRDLEDNRIKKLKAKYPQVRKWAWELIRKNHVQIGMSEIECELSWGSPERKNNSVNAYNTRSQWVYGSGNYLYMKNGYLESISTSN